MHQRQEVVKLNHLVRLGRHRSQRSLVHWFRTTLPLPRRTLPTLCLSLGRLLCSLFRLFPRIMALEASLSFPIRQWVRRCIRSVELCLDF